MTPRWPLPEQPPALDVGSMQLTNFVRQWQKLNDRHNQLLALIDQRRAQTGAARISPEEATALAEGAEVIRRLDAIITGILETHEAEDQH